MSQSQMQVTVFLTGTDVIGQFCTELGSYINKQENWNYIVIVCFIPKNSIFSSKAFPAVKSLELKAHHTIEMGHEV